MITCLRLLRKLREAGKVGLSNKIKNSDYYDPGDLQRLCTIITNGYGTFILKKS